MKKLLLVLSLLTLNLSIMPMQSNLFKLRKPVNYAAMIGVRNLTAGTLILASATTIINLCGVYRSSNIPQTMLYGASSMVMLNSDSVLGVTGAMALTTIGYINEFDIRGRASMEKTEQECIKIEVKENELLKQIILKQQNEIELLKKK